MRSHAEKPMKGREGFTAIELAAVASIIAILALILIPIVRKRLDAARETAVLDDMRTIEVAQMMASADTAFYFRLNDLDNPSLDTDTWNNPASTAAEFSLAASVIPNGTWNRNFGPLEETTATTFANRQIGTIGARWAGPYTTFNKTKFILMADALATGSDLRFRQVDISVTPGVTLAGTGPIPIHDDTTDTRNDDEDQQEHYPSDPWGGAYIFFGPGRFGTQLGATALSASTQPETNFGVAVVYSTGPNIVPGNNAAPAATDYFREFNVLGQGDDYYRIF